MNAGFPPSKLMALALEAAHEAQAVGEVPIGAVIVSPNGDILSVAGNRTITQHDPTAHAEILAIREACQKLGSQRLIDCDLYVTLEPCPMCAAAISFARIRRLYYGASDIKSGGVEQGPRVFSHQSCHHVPEIYSGISENKSASLLTAFFRDRR